MLTSSQYGSGAHLARQTSKGSAKGRHGIQTGLPFSGEIIDRPGLNIAPFGRLPRLATPRFDQTNSFFHGLRPLPELGGGKGANLHAGFTLRTLFLCLVTPRTSDASIENKKENPPNRFPSTNSRKGVPFARGVKKERKVSQRHLRSSDRPQLTGIPEGTVL